jgi:carbamoyltransferase
MAQDAGQDVGLNPALRAQFFGIPTARVGHHLAHAVSAYSTSGFTEAAVLVVDGMGSPWADLDDGERNAVQSNCQDGWESHSLYRASPVGVTALEKHLVERGRWMVANPHGMPTFNTLGGMYGAAARQIFGEASDAGKVMGLAPHGSPAIPVDEFFEHCDGAFRFHDIVPRRFTTSARWPDLRAEYVDLAASVQKAVESGVRHLTERLRDLAGPLPLAYAGGVALNGVANEQIIASGRFPAVHVIPAAEDSGTAVGAAYYGHWMLTGRLPSRRLSRDAPGASYRHGVSAALTRSFGVRPERVDNPAREVAERLAAGDIVGLATGGSELGPRALGQRSILCDPRRADARDVLNARIKGRESFRPFAPVVLADVAEDWFELGNTRESPFMLRICRVSERCRSKIPAVVHVDGTARPQTVTRTQNAILYSIVEEFGKLTGVPVLVNTSFNYSGEPIVETPDDVLLCALACRLDACLIEDTLVRPIPTFHLLDYVPLVCATAISIRVDPGVGLAPRSLVCEVVTPWGRAEVVLSPVFLALLNEIDGVRSGREIAERLRCRGIVGHEAEVERSLWRLTRVRVVAYSQELRS